MKKYSLLGLVLVTASSLIAVFSTSKAADTDKKALAGPGHLTASSGNVLSALTCVSDENGVDCDYTSTVRSGTSFGGATTNTFGVVGDDTGTVTSM